MAKAEPCITTSIRVKTQNRLLKYLDSIELPPSQVDVISLAVERYLSDLERLNYLDSSVKNEGS
jgi:hypothetical protein